MEDRYAYERAMLRFMLTLRTCEGLPVVWAETLLREFVEDLGAGFQTYEGDPAEIAAWAMGTGEGMTGVTSDVHLAVYGDGSGTVAKLLGPEPRFVLQKVTRLSVPVTVLCRSSGTLPCPP